MNQPANNSAATSKQQNPVRINNMRKYALSDMGQDAEQFVEGGNLKSGYSNLDAITNIYPGLYVIGAISSLGKTTFIHQMADQMAMAGQPVLFFSLEQSTLELASKSLSRIQAHGNVKTAMTSLQIRKHFNDPRVVTALNKYCQYADNLMVVECSFRATIADIEKCVRAYIDKFQRKPVVIIDYLQVIQPPEGSHMTDKDLVDMHVRHLKQLQSDNSLALIVISSLNRQNYLSLIDFESFKESGGIEYTADVLWGLQLRILHDEVFDQQNKLNEKRTKVREAKAANPRKIELVCLKNRFGVSSYSCAFDYYPAFDYFIPDLSDIDEKAIEAASGKDPDGFIKLPEGLKTPFD